MITRGEYPEKRDGESTLYVEENKNHVPYHSFAAHWHNTHTHKKKKHRQINKNCAANADFTTPAHPHACTSADVIRGKKRNNMRATKHREKKK